MTQNGRFQYKTAGFCIRQVFNLHRVHSMMFSCLTSRTETEEVDESTAPLLQTALHEETQSKMIQDGPDIFHHCMRVHLYVGSQQPVTSFEAMIEDMISVYQQASHLYNGHKQQMNSSRI
jgi:hypothetical protein